MKYELPDWKIKTVNELCKDNIVFLGLDKELIADLFGDFSNMLCSASFLMLDNEGNIKNTFIDWVTKSPLQRAIELKNKGNYEIL